MKPYLNIAWFDAMDGVGCRLDVFGFSADVAISNIYARAGFLPSSISTFMRSPGAGMHTKRFASTR